jgi:hypothetical protein
MKTQVIKKLVDQVGTDTSGKWIQVDKLPEFAKLIVNECAKIADTAEPFLASDLIKEHFGVEE